jgi:cell division protein FtsB
MASRNAAARTRTSEPRPASPRPRPTVIRGQGAKAIRWDRVGRVTLLIVLLGVTVLYIGPSISFFHTWQQSKQERSAVNELQRESARLKAERLSLTKGLTLTREARRLGLVKPGELPFLVKGLPGD